MASVGRKIRNRYSSGQKVRGIDRNNALGKFRRTQLKVKLNAREFRAEKEKREAEEE